MFEVLPSSDETRSISSPENVDRNRKFGHIGFQLLLQVVLLRSVVHLEERREVLVVPTSASSATYSCLIKDD